MAIITVSTNATTLFKLSRETNYDYTGMYNIWIKNTGATALSSCVWQGRNCSRGSWDTVTTADLLKMTSDSIDLTVLAPGQEWNGSFDNSTLVEIQLVATVAAGTTTLDLEKAFVPYGYN